LSAQSFRVATWQAGDLLLPPEPGKPAQANLDRVQAVAAALGVVEADVILLYGVPNGETAIQIADALKPHKYSLAIHSLFRSSGSVGQTVGQPFAILSRRGRMAAKNINWRDTGRIDLPGGFTFATFQHAQGAMCLYVAGLPGSLTNILDSTGGAYFARKRNAAAEYLAFHTSWVTTTYTNEPFATYLTCDLNVAPKSPVKDECGKILERAGFRVMSPGPAQDKSAISITNVLALDRVMDPIFTRNVEFMASRQIAQPAPLPPIVVCELTLKPANTSAALAPKAARPASRPPVRVEPQFEPYVEPAAVAAVVSPVVKPASAPVPQATTAAQTPPPVTTVPVPAPAMSATVPASNASGSVLDRPWVLPSVIGAFVLAVSLAVLRARSSRRGGLALSMRRRASDSMFVEMEPSQPRPIHPGPRAGRPSMITEATTASGNAQNALWRSASAPVEAHPEDALRAGLMSHFRRLMREKLFYWLNRQRTQLIESHETGTKKVLGLEERLEKIQDQFQDRLVAQEERIAELNRELQAKERAAREKAQQQFDSNQSSN
jgi:hypothetical protein